MNINYQYYADQFYNLIQKENANDNELISAILAYWEVVDLHNTYAELVNSRIEQKKYNKIIADLFIEYYSYSNFFDIMFEFDRAPEPLQDFMYNYKPFLRFLLNIFMQDNSNEDLLSLHFEFNKLNTDIQSFFKTQDAFKNLVKQKYSESNLPVNSRNLEDLLSKENMEHLFKVGNKNYLNQNNFIYNKALRVCSGIESYTTEYNPWLSEYIYLCKNLDFASGALLVSCLTVSSRHLSQLHDYLNQMPRKKTFDKKSLSLHSKIQMQIKKCRMYLSRTDVLNARFEMYINMKTRLRNIIAKFVNENQVFTRAVNIQNVILPMFPLALGIPGGSCMDDTIISLMINPSLAASIKGSHYFISEIYENVNPGMETFAMITMGSLYRHLHEKTKASRGSLMIRKRICPFYTKIMNTLFSDLKKRMKIESYILARCSIIEKMNNKTMQNYMNQIGDAL